MKMNQKRYMLYSLWNKFYFGFVSFWRDIQPTLLRIAFNSSDIKPLPKEEPNAFNMGMSIAYSEEAEVCLDAWQHFLRTAEEYIRKGT